eukprot:IDg7017t1
MLARPMALTQLARQTACIRRAGQMARARRSGRWSTGAGVPPADVIDGTRISGASPGDDADLTSAKKRHVRRSQHPVEYRVGPLKEDAAAWNCSQSAERATLQRCKSDKGDLRT